MKFSLSLPVFREPSHRDPFWQSFELARIAEASGFDTVTIGHHHLMPGNQSDPLTFMTAVAARTQTLRAGSVLREGQACLFGSEVIPAFTG